MSTQYDKDIKQEDDDENKDIPLIQPELSSAQISRDMDDKTKMGMKEEDEAVEELETFLSMFRDQTDNLPSTSGHSEKMRNGYVNYVQHSCKLCSKKYPLSMLLNAHYIRDHRLAIVRSLDQTTGKAKIKYIRTVRVKERNQLRNERENFAQAEKQEQPPSPMLFYECEFCGERYASEKDYFAHRDKDHRMATVQSLDQTTDNTKISYIRTVGVEEERNQPRNEENLIVEERKEPSSQMLYYECKFCGERYESEKEYLAHINKYSVTESDSATTSPTTEALRASISNDSSSASTASSPHHSTGSNGEKTSLQSGFDGKPAPSSSTATVTQSPTKRIGKRKNATSSKKVSSSSSSSSSASRPRGRPCHNEELAASHGLPVSAAEIGDMSHINFSQLLYSASLTIKQKRVLYMIRRREMNRLSFRRKRYQAKTSSTTTTPTPETMGVSNDSSICTASSTPSSAHNSTGSDGEKDQNPPSSSVMDESSSSAPRPCPSLYRDEELAAAHGLPVGAAEISNMSQFNFYKLLYSDSLTDQQKKLINQIRQRGRGRAYRLRKKNQAKTSSTTTAPASEAMGVSNDSSISSASSTSSQSNSTGSDGGKDQNTPSSVMDESSLPQLPGGRPTKDDELAASNGLPVSAAEISNMSLLDFDILLASDSLNDQQKQLMKTIRKRGKNKAASRICKQRRKQAKPT